MPQRRVAVLRPERPMQDVRREAAAAHPGHDRGREAGCHDPVAEALEGGDPVREVLGGVEPAQAFADGLLDGGIVRPQARVAIEQAVGPVLVACPIARDLERGLAVAEGELGRGHGGRRGVGHRGLRARADSRAGPIGRVRPMIRPVRSPVR